MSLPSEAQIFPQPTGIVGTSGSPSSGNLAKFSDDHTITSADLTGDVTTSGTVATTIANGAVTEGKIGLSDVTTDDVSTTKHGFAPKLPNDAAKFLNGVGGWSAPSGSSSGSCVLTDNAYPGSVNMTTEGTLDWLILLNAVANSPDTNIGSSTHRKLNPFQWIRGFRPVGSTLTSSATGADITFSWSAGDDCAQAGSGSTTTGYGLFNSGSNGLVGVVFNVPCDGTSRTLRIYCVHRSDQQNKILASSTDGSISFNSGLLATHGNSLYKIVYNGSQPGGILSVAVLYPGAQTLGGTAFIGVEGITLGTV